MLSHLDQEAPLYYVSRIFILTNSDPWRSTEHPAYKGRPSGQNGSFGGVLDCHLDLLVGSYFTAQTYAVVHSWRHPWKFSSPLWGFKKIRKTHI